MNLIITGVNGLLGSTLYQKLQCDPSLNVKGLGRSTNPSDSLMCIDILDLESLIDAFKGQECVIHTAALVSFSKKDKLQMMKTNVIGTANVVDACIAAGVKKLIHVSSVAAIGRPHTVFNNPIPTHINENNKWTNSPLNSNYAISKYEAELEVWRGEAEGLEVLVVNPSIILGEGDIHKSSSKLFGYVWNENKFLVKGRVNYVDVVDVCSAIASLLKSSKSGERYILNGGTTNYKELFSKMAGILNKKGPSIYLNNFLIDVLWKFEALRSFLTGSNPLITKETSLTARTNVIFNSQKIITEFDFEFTPLDITIERVGKFILNKYGRIKKVIEFLTNTFYI